MSEAKREVWFVHWNNGPSQPFRRSGPYYDPEEATESADGLNQFNAACQASVVRYVPESAQPAERAGEWVSVEERLPPTGCNVIVDGGCAFFDGQAWRSSMASGAMRKIEWEVTHWMPLPPPPQPKEKP